MFEIDYKSIKKGNLFGYIFLFVGLVVMIIVSYILVSSIIKKNSLDREVRTDYIEENGHYDDEGTYMYTPIYHYTVNGKEYVCSGNISSSKRPSSSGIVYYKKGDPSNCMTDYSANSNWFWVIFIILGGVFAGIGAGFLFKSFKNVKKAKYLSKNGKLIKGIPYTMENSNTSVNGRILQKIAIDYTLPNGNTVHLTGNPRYDYKTFDEDGLVDLLIDPNDYNNYFIDFEIKYSGNVQVEQYYNPTPSINQNVIGNNNNFNN